MQPAMSLKVATESRLWSVQKDFGHKIHQEYWLKSAARFDGVAYPFWSVHRWSVRRIADVVSHHEHRQLK